MVFKIAEFTLGLQPVADRTGAHCGTDGGSTAATLKLDRTGRPFNLLDFNGACHRFPIRAKATTQYLGDESVDPRQSLSAYPPPRYR